MAIKNTKRNARTIYQIKYVTCAKVLQDLKADEDDELFIMANVHKNTSFVIEDNYRYGHNKVVIVLHSVINNCIKTS